MTIEFKQVYAWRLIDTDTGLLSKVPCHYNSDTEEYIHVDDEYTSIAQAYEALSLLVTEETKWKYSGDDFKLVDSARAYW